MHLSKVFPNLDRVWGAKIKKNLSHHSTIMVCCMGVLCPVRKIQQWKHNMQWFVDWCIVYPCRLISVVGAKDKLRPIKNPKEYGV